MSKTYQSLAVSIVAIGAACLGVTTLPGVGRPLVAQSTTSRSPADEADLAPAKSLSNAFRAVANEVLPAVVSIENRPPSEQDGDRALGEGDDPFGGQNPFEGTPFEDFFKGSPFGEMPRQFRQMPRGRSAGIGSGVIIDSSGVILTNNHVVEGGGEVTVRLVDGREFKAIDVKTDPKTDLAIVRINGADDLVAARLGDSEEAQVGDWVLALGQPFGLESTVTAGIISARHRGIGIAARESFLQTDAAINPGNSGGPLVNLDGEVVGINTAISSRSGGNNGVGFAVPINLAKWVVEQLEEDGVVHRAYLGVQIQPVSQDLADEFGVNPRQGVLVTQVFPGTPAAKMGLQSGDIVVSLNGTEVGSAQELQLLVEQMKIGKTHPLEIVRDGKKLTLDFRAESQPDDYGKQVQTRTPSQSLERSNDDAWGLGLDELTPAVARQLGMEGVRGVVITSVEADKGAEEAGLQAGMVIRQINKRDVATVAEARTMLQAAEEAGTVLLLVQTENGSRYLVIEK